MRSYAPHLLLALLAVAFPRVAGALPAGPSGHLWALQSQVSVNADRVSLAELLPDSAPSELRSAASRVSLGATPDFGAIRRLDRAGIASAIESSGLSPADFAIPEIVTIRRSGRHITREEVFRAVRAAYDKQKPAKAPPLSFTDFEMNVSPWVPAGDPRLEVTHMTYDPILGLALFRIASKSVLAMVPFEVSASLPERAKVSPAGFAPLRPQAADPVLVDPRKPARLLLHSQDAEILLQVRPLERGHLGETIRVRLPQNGRTFRARVTGDSALEAVF